MGKNQPVRRRDYDLLRVVSMAAVVYLHTAANDLEGVNTTALWQFSNWTAALSTAAVPLFFMLSGALLLSAERTGDPAFVLKRRLPHIVVPGLFWSALVIGGTWFFKSPAEAFFLLQWLPSTTVLTPYWFLYALIPMYLLAPVLRLMTERMEEGHWRYLLGLWVAVTLALRSVFHLVPQEWKPFFYENTIYTISAVGGYLGYFLLGLYLSRLKGGPKPGLLWAVVAVDWVVISLGTAFFREKIGVYAEQFLDYRGLFAAVLATALFLLARHYCAGKESPRLLRVLAGCSFGVYLSHPFAIKVARLLVPMGGISGQMLTWALALVGSVVGVVLVQSVKPLCFLVTGQSFSTACRESNLFALLGKGRWGPPPS